MAYDDDMQKDAPASAEGMSAQDWLENIKVYEEDFEKWAKQRENLDKLFAKTDRADSADREYSIFWANLEVLKPAVYARPPVPVVVPKFKDGNPISREASELLERCAIVTGEAADVDGLMREVRDEYLRYGRGTAWARLAQRAMGRHEMRHSVEALTPPEADGEASEAPEEMGQERQTQLTVEFDWVTACDFAHDPARSWRNVKWVARRVWLSRKQGQERFGDVFEYVPLKKRVDETGTKTADKAAVWEIWCKNTEQVYFVAEDCDEILDQQDPWLDLRGFFPCPKPCYGTTVPGSLVPVPEIVQYKDQVEEINEYTARIAALSESLRLRGFYPAGAGDISEAIEAAMKSMDDRQVLVPLSSFAAMGGSSLKDSIVWIPVDQVIQTINALVDLRRAVIEDVYQITGISDIVRGSTKASETLGAQQLKSQWGSIRIRERQQELVRFARDIVRIMVEIMAEELPPETLMQMSQMQLPTMADQQQAQMFLAQVQQAAMMAQQQRQPFQPPQDQLKAAEKALKSPSVEAVMQFLRDDRARGFVIDVETDSTIQPDEDAEKQRRIEFVTAIGGMFQQAAPIIMQAPVLAPFAVELLKFAAGAFRAGRPLEGVIDQLGEAIEGFAEQAAQPQQPEQQQPDPTEVLKLEGQKAKTEADMMKAQGSMAKTQMDVQAHTIKTQNNIARIQAESQAEALTPGINAIYGGSS